MKRNFLIAGILSLSIGYHAFAQEIGEIEVVSDELAKIVKKDAEIEVIADGFQFTEGPLWVVDKEMLLFSDVPANIIYQWTEKDGASVFVKPGGYTDPAPRGGFMGPNGMILNHDGDLWICQHGDRRIAELDAPLDAPEAKFTTVIGAYEGKGLNSPNDLFLTEAGDLYFTDPAYGFEGGPSDPNKELDFQGVYKLSKSGELTVLIDSLSTPNGISIFPDGKTLLVSNTAGPKRGWYSYDIASDGSVSNGRLFASPGDIRALGGCDGLKIDKKGTVFATGPGGVWIFTKKSKLIGKIKVNGLTAANVALSPDEKTLYITATDKLLRVKLR